MMHFLLASIVLGSLTAGEIVSTASYTHSTELIENEEFHVFWKFDETTITFEVHAKTLGWVGFGLSPNGGMAGSDVIITWVKDGKTFFSDRHAVGKYEPVVDESQDWTLISAQESGEYTIITVSRKHVTGDSEDLCITGGTMRLIYSMNPNDPTSESGPLEKHSVRGSKSVQLLSVQRETEPTLPDDAFPFDVLNEEGRPSGYEDTTYWCQAFKPPQLNNTKHHVVMIEPIIEEGHEWLVHHMLLYACNFDLPEPYTPEIAHGYAGNCYMRSDEQMRGLMECQSVSFAWAVGGGKLWLPDHVGIPLGDDKYPTLFRLETHYDNPDLMKNLTDHSGLRLWLSPTLRDNDAAILQVGMGVNQNQVVPPQSDAFFSQGVCHGDCLAEVMKEVNRPNIKLIGSLLHSHLAGFGLRVRHIRDGIELPPILVDNSYDFNFQEMRLLNKEVTIVGGDHLLTDCAYKTKDRTKVTMGGISTMDEMCLSFLMYYPKIPIAKCESSPTTKQLSTFLDAEGMETECDYPGWAPGLCFPRITKPQERSGQYVYEVLKDISWDTTRKERIQKITTEGEIILTCQSTHEEEEYETEEKVTAFPKISKVYDDGSIYSQCPSAFELFGVSMASAVEFSFAVLLTTLVTLISVM